jgi:NAD(P)-dependent dehydrogenase (short-subunit alcohol dehydrogenase family)
MTESRIPDFTSVPLVDLWSLTGKVAIITGGGSGMGQATAVRFAEAGAAVVVVDIAPAGSAETLELIAQQTPDDAAGHAIQVDITDPAGAGARRCRR